MMASFAQQGFRNDSFSDDAFVSKSIPEWRAARDVAISSKASGWLSHLLRRAAVWSIGVYQIYISPRKGFRCPHHQLHGVDSCSRHIRNLFSSQELPMSSVLAQTIVRFQECNLASQILGQDSPRMKCYVIPCCFPL
jgi:putative component of membrane protein insertase Oxa1/YidC/SpoIIIJ protein YidD